MLTPQKPAGQQQTGRVKVLIAIHALQTAIPELGVLSEEGKTVLDAIRTLTKRFGKSEDSDKGLMPAEIAQIMQRAGPGAAPVAPKPAAPPAAAAGAAPPMAA